MKHLWCLEDIMIYPRNSAAAVSFIIREDDRFLCVWNSRYQGFSLPGGKVEAGESVEQAQSRELMEETGLETLEAELVFHGPHNLKVESTRGSEVYIFKVRAKGEPKEMEPGHPLKWMNKEEFLAESCFGLFYREVFEKVKL